MAPAQESDSPTDWTNADTPDLGSSLPDSPVFPLRRIGDSTDSESEEERVEQTVTNLFSTAPAPSFGVDPPATATTMPAAATSAGPDMRLVHQELKSLGRFDDEGVPITEAEYRYRFKSITADLADDERARLWVNNLLYNGAAWWWHYTLVQDQTGATAASAWSTLEPRIEEHWPTPVLDVRVYQRAKRKAWEAHKLEVASMIDELEDDSAPTSPHALWAQRHQALARACNSTNEDRVSRTLEHALPRFVIELLPKGYEYGDQFKELCDDVGKINARTLLRAYQRESTQEALLASLSNLAIQESRPAPRAQRLLPRTQPTVLAPPPAPAAAPSPTSAISDRIPWQQRTASAAATQAPAQSQTPRVSFGPSAAATRTPARTTGSAPSAMAAPRQSNPPPSQTASDLSAPPEDTPEGREEYARRVAEWNEKFPGMYPSPARPFPLSPGTRAQTLELCVKCGRGEHLAIDCSAPPNQHLPERERAYRSLLVRQIRANAPRARPGPARTRETYVVEVVEDEYDAEYLGSENEEGQ